MGRLRKHHGGSPNTPPEQLDTAKDEKERDHLLKQWKRAMPKWIITARMVR